MIAEPLLAPLSGLGRCGKGKAIRTRLEIEPLTVAEGRRTGGVNGRSGANVRWSGPQENGPSMSNGNPGARGDCDSSNNAVFMADMTASTGDQKKGFPCPAP